LQYRLTSLAEERGVQAAVATPVVVKSLYSVRCKFLSMGWHLAEQNHISRGQADVVGGSGGVVGMKEWEVREHSSFRHPILYGRHVCFPL
jgi:hypothetical protein